MHVFSKPFTFAGVQPMAGVDPRVQPLQGVACRPVVPQVFIRNSIGKRRPLQYPSSISNTSVGAKQATLSSLPLAAHLQQPRGGFTHPISQEVLVFGPHRNAYQCCHPQGIYAPEETTSPHQTALLTESDNDIAHRNRECHRLQDLIQKNECKTKEELSIFEDHTEPLQACMNTALENKGATEARLAGVEEYMHVRDEQFRRLEEHCEQLLKRYEEEKSVLADERRAVKEAQRKVENTQTVVLESSKVLQDKMDAFTQAQEVHQQNVLLQQACIQRREESLQLRIHEVETKVKALNECAEKEWAEILCRKKMVASSEAQMLNANRAIDARRQELAEDSKRLQIQVASNSAAEESLKQRSAEVAAEMGEFKTFQSTSLEQINILSAAVDVRAMRLAEAEEAFAERLARLVMREAALECKSEEVCEKETPRPVSHPFSARSQDVAAFEEQQPQDQPGDLEGKCIRFQAPLGETFSSYRLQSSTCDSADVLSFPCAGGTTSNLEKVETFTSRDSLEAPCTADCPTKQLPRLALKMEGSSLSLLQKDEQDDRSPQTPAHDAPAMKVAQFFKSVATTYARSRSREQDLETMMQQLKEAGAQTNNLPKGTPPKEEVTILQGASNLATHIQQHFVNALR